MSVCVAYIHRNYTTVTTFSLEWVKYLCLLELSTHVHARRRSHLRSCFNESRAVDPEEEPRGRNSRNERERDTQNNSTKTDERILRFKIPVIIKSMTLSGGMSWLFLALL